MSEPDITSRQNPRIKQACALRSRASRDQSQTTLVYGVRESQRAFELSARPICVFWCEKHFRSPEATQVVDQLSKAGAESYSVSSEVFEKLAYGDRMDGVVAVFETRSPQLTELQLPRNPLVAVLEGIEKPGNLGAILRSADGAGVDAVVVVDAVIDLFNPNAIRASVAAVFQPNLAIANVAEVQNWLVTLGLNTYAARPDATTSYYRADYTQGSAIVLGSEAQGLTEAWNTSHVSAVAIPMLGAADSLNVSTSAAVMFYEARRQRDLATA